jgi:hypothetical protein
VRERERERSLRKRGIHVLSLCMYVYEKANVSDFIERERKG